MDEVSKFAAEVAGNIEALKADSELQEMSRTWLQMAGKHRYSYNFSWLGRPIIQHPTDMLALQEIIWNVRPNLIIETGIAHGGSLIFSASILELIGGDGIVVGIDIDIRSHNRVEIERHPLSKRLTLLEGSSTSPSILSQVKQLAKGRDRVMVILDSNHTHAHVAQELELYSPLVTKGSYLVALDTVIEDVDESMVAERPWGKGNNPKTAVWEFLRENNRFEIDHDIEGKLLITVAPDGYLKCIRD